MGNDDNRVDGPWQPAPAGHGTERFYLGCGCGLIMGLPLWVVLLVLGRWLASWL